jgi:hypothetical protein
MQTSRVIEIDGVFLGAALSLPDAQGWRIIAADTRVGRVNGMVAANWSEAQKLVRQAFFTWRPEPAVRQVA